MANQATVPRVLNADELRHGMIVAIAGHSDHGKWIKWEATLALESNLEAIEGKLRIVLLEDAGEESEPVKVGDTISTLEELEALPCRSVVLGHIGDAHQKGGKGEWWETARPEGRDPEDVARFAPFAVLHLGEGDASSPSALAETNQRPAPE